MKKYFQKLIDNPFLLWFCVFLFIHIALLNINAVEWGDSYRILRAAKYLREFSYPSDEKRPPLYSLLLSGWPQGIDPVVWGRIVMLGIGAASVATYALLVRKFSDSKRYMHIALMLFVLNPVYMYWSLRIMADAFFTLLVMVEFLIFYRFKKKNTLVQTFTLGLVAGLAVLTRFEGYLLYFAILLGIVVDSHQDLWIKNLFRRLRHSFWQLSTYVLGFLVVIGPYFFLRNPLKSSYLAEPSGRVYDINTILIYLVSLLFIYGFIVAAPFILNGRNVIKQFFTQHLAVLFFLSLELALILMWPAAIPRLFIAVIPFLIVLLALGIENFFSQNKKDNAFLFIGLITLGIYIVGQYKYRLQFLVLQKEIFAILIFINLLLIVTAYFKKFRSFFLVTAFSCGIWSLATVHLHKDIYLVVSLAGNYLKEHSCGVVVHNDLTSVIDWNVNYGKANVCGSTIYYPKIDSGDIAYDDLEGFDATYVVVTNEHNTSMEFELSKYPYLSLEREYAQSINGAHFVTKVLKFHGYELN